MSVVSIESRGRYEDERTLAGAAKMAEERKAATNAKARALDMHVRTQQAR